MPAGISLFSGSSVVSNSEVASSAPHFLKSYPVFGLDFGLSEGGPLPSGVGGVSSKAAALKFVPRTAVPSRPSCVRRVSECSSSFIDLEDHPYLEIGRRIGTSYPLSLIHI